MAGKLFWGVAPISEQNSFRTTGHDHCFTHIRQVGILHNLWGGPPGRGALWAGSPWTRASLDESVVRNRQQADRGVGRGPGVNRPTICAAYSFGENCRSAAANQTAANITVIKPRAIWQSL